MRKLLIPACHLACLVACLLAMAASTGPLARAGRAQGNAIGSGTGAGPAHAAQRIYIDLATGQLREPTTAELAAERTQSAGGLQASQKQASQAAAAGVGSADELRLPDGTVGVRPARQFLHTIVLCRQPDGSFGAQCADAGSTR
jgi:hypothetical protein